MGVNYPDPPTLSSTISTPQQVINLLRVLKFNERMGKITEEERIRIAKSLVSEQTAQEILDWMENNVDTNG